MKRLLSLCALVLIASCASTPDDTTVEASPTEADDYTPFAIQFILRAPANAPEEWVETTMREALDTFVVAWTGERYPLDAWASFDSEGKIVLVEDGTTLSADSLRKRIYDATGAGSLVSVTSEQLDRGDAAAPQAKDTVILISDRSDYCQPAWSLATGTQGFFSFAVIDLGAQDLPGDRAYTLVAGDCEAVGAVARSVQWAKNFRRIPNFSKIAPRNPHGIIHSEIDWQRVVINYD